MKFDFSDSILIPSEAGNTIEFTQSSTLVYNDDNVIKLDAHIKESGIPSKISKSEGSAKIVLSVLKHPALTFNGKYDYDPTQDLKKGVVTLNLVNGEKEASIAIDSEYLPDLSSLSTNIKVTTPIEKIKIINLQFIHKVCTFYFQILFYN